MATMLIVEDDRLIALVLRRQLARLGHTVLPPMASAEDGLAVVLTSHPAVVFMDLYCADLLDRLTVGPLIEAVGTPVVYLSHASRAAFPAAHGGLAPLFHLMKPLAAEVVARTLEWALAYGALQRLVQALRHGVVERLAQVPVLEARGYPIVPPGQERRERLEGGTPPPRSPRPHEPEAPVPLSGLRAAPPRLAARGEAPGQRHAAPPPGGPALRSGRAVPAAHGDGDDRRSPDGGL